MTTLQLDKQTAIKLYPSAVPEFKAMMEQTFGKKTFVKDVRDIVKTFEDACLETGDNPNDEKFIKGTPDDIAYQKLKVITKALNEGWQPNWNNSNERKWRLWFYLDSPGFRLHGADYGSSCSSVGSRLCFKSEELALYAANQFLSLYKDLFTY